MWLSVSESPLLNPKSAKAGQGLCFRAGLLQGAGTVPAGSLCRLCLSLYDLKALSKVSKLSP